MPTHVKLELCVSSSDRNVKTAVEESPSPETETVMPLELDTVSMSMFSHSALGVCDRPSIASLTVQIRLKTDPAVGEPDVLVVTFRRLLGTGNLKDTVTYALHFW